MSHARDKGLGRLPRRQIKKGETITARFLNQRFVREDARRVQDDYGPGIEPEPAGASSSPRRFTIASEQVDTVTATDSTVIAKPEVLRGNVGSRTLGGENQVILYAYVSGFGAPVESTVWASNVGDAETGIPGVDWIDLNNQGRMWAEDS